MIPFLLSGCGISYFAHRDTNPSIEGVVANPFTWFWQDANMVFTNAATASRRMVLVNVKEDGWVKQKMTTCAEPSPDVGEALASAVSDALKLAVTEPKTGINGTLSNDYTRAAITQITPLIYRTQSLQLYRDAIHSHCIDRMNGWYPNNDKNLEPVGQPVKIKLDDVNQDIKKDLAQDGFSVNQRNKSPGTQEIEVYVNDYNSMKMFYFAKAVEALKAEIPFVLKAQEEFAKNLKTTGISDQSIKALVDLTKNLSPTTITSTPSGTSIVSGSNVKTDPAK